jgi:hypothetical protein
MSHFAKIENNIVTEILVVHNELEHRGADFLANDLGLGGTWIQTSYNNNIRKQYAGVGFSYDSVADVFIAPQPYPSWALDNDFNWQAPTPRPEGMGWYWNEVEQVWVDAN